MTPDALVEDATAIDVPPAVRGGAARGRVLHKLLEEVLTGDTGESLQTLRARAAELICEPGLSAAADPLSGLEPGELADCVAAGCRRRLEK